jgi:hypothetical protein
MLRRNVPGLQIIDDKLIERIDAIIDGAYGEHDLGRKPDIRSFGRMLAALFIEFGDLVKNGKWLKTSRRERESYINQLMLTARLGIPPTDFPNLSQYSLYIPDAALALSTLHHMLDLFMECLPNTGATTERCGNVVDCVARGIRHYVSHLQSADLRTMTGESFDKVVLWLLEVFRQHCDQIYEVLADELRRKGLEPGCTAGALRKALSHYIAERGLYGVVCVSEGEPHTGQPLPVASAAAKVYSNLEKRKSTTVYLTLRGINPCEYHIDKLEFRSYADLCKFIKELHVKSPPTFT